MPLVLVGMNAAQPPLASCDTKTTYTPHVRMLLSFLLTPLCSGTQLCHTPHARGFGCLNYSVHVSVQTHDPYTLVVALDERGTASGQLYVDDGASFAFQRGQYLHRCAEVGVGVSRRARYTKGKGGVVVLHVGHQQNNGVLRAAVEGRYAVVSLRRRRGDAEWRVWVERPAPVHPRMAWCGCGAGLGCAESLTSRQVGTCHSLPHLACAGATRLPSTPAAPGPRCARLDSYPRPSLYNSPAS